MNLETLRVKGNGHLTRLRNVLLYLQYCKMGHEPYVFHKLWSIDNYYHFFYSFSSDRRK